MVFLVDKGAEVDAVGGELNATPLHWATRQGHLDAVVILKNAGADPTLRDAEGCSWCYIYHKPPTPSDNDSLHDLANDLP